MLSFFMRLAYLPRRLGQLLILGYQHSISPDHGVIARFIPYKTCRYTPTCSEYSYWALDKYGLMKGSWMTAKRLARCTPWHAGGHDPVP